MSCLNVRLEEYMDGELGPAEAAEVGRHLEDCSDCRRELEGLRLLERLLRVGPVGPAPDADRFTERVRRRARVRSAAWLAAAAALLIALGTFLLVPRQEPLEPRAELAAYALSPTPERESRIVRAGPAGLAALEAALEDPDPRVQFAAAALLFRHADAPLRERVLGRFRDRRESDGAWTLGDPGTEDSDVELVAVAISALEGGGSERWALKILRKLQGLNRRAQARIVDSVLTLLKTPDPRVQELALDIVRELDMEFPLSAIVELLDSPELGEAARNVLRKATGKDFGKDKEAWRKETVGKEKGL